MRFWTLCNQGWQRYATCCFASHRGVAPLWELWIQTPSAYRTEPTRNTCRTEPNRGGSCLALRSGEPLPKVEVSLRESLQKSSKRQVVKRHASVVCVCACANKCVYICIYVNRYMYKYIYIYTYAYFHNWVIIYIYKCTHISEINKINDFVYPFSLGKPLAKSIRSMIVFILSR